MHIETVFELNELSDAVHELYDAWNAEDQAAGEAARGRITEVADFLLQKRGHRNSIAGANKIFDEVGPVLSDASAERLEQVKVDIQRDFAEFDRNFFLSISDFSAGLFAELS